MHTFLPYLPVTSWLQLARNILLSTFKALYNCKYLLSDYQMLFLTTLNACKFTPQDFQMAYNMAGGKGLHSTETAIALNRKLAHVCLYTDATNFGLLAPTVWPQLECVWDEVSSRK